MKRYIPFILTAVFPYYITVILCMMFLVPAIRNTGAPDISMLLLLLPLFFLLVLVCNVIFACLLKAKRIDFSSVELAKANMIMRVSQIPAYIVIFIMGVMCLITIFTIGISLALVLLDCMAIFISGIIGVVAVWQNYEDGTASVKQAVVLSICQFIFCIDVIGGIMLYIKAKNTKRTAD